MIRVNVPKIEISHRLLYDEIRKSASVIQIHIPASGLKSKIHPRVGKGEAYILTTHKAMNNAKGRYRSDQ
jgi:hypothetical protein